MAHVPDSSFNWGFTSQMRADDTGCFQMGHPKEGTAFHRTQPAGKHSLNLTKRKRHDFSGPAAKDPSDSAGGVRPIPGPGRVYTLQGTYAVCLEPMLCGKGSHCHEPQLGSGPHDPRVGKAHRERHRPGATKGGQGAPSEPEQRHAPCSDWPVFYKCRDKQEKLSC